MESGSLNTPPMSPMLPFGNFKPTTFAELEDVCSPKDAEESIDDLLLQLFKMAQVSFIYSKIISFYIAYISTRCSRLQPLLLLQLLLPLMLPRCFCRGYPCRCCDRCCTAAVTYVADAPSAAAAAYATSTVSAAATAADEATA